MQIRYKGPSGNDCVVQLDEKKTAIVGRSTDVDIVVDDEKASRRHCEIRCWDGDFIIKDLHSRNGTLVNGDTVDVRALRPGDQIAIGNRAFFFEEKTPMGNTTALRSVEGEMEEGKGYNTILREIVDDVEDGGKK